MSTVEHLRNADARTAGGAGPAVRRSTAEVVVSVGTDHHRFDRLVGWIDEWRDRHPEVVTVVQAGTSRPSRHDSRELIPHSELLQLFRGATVVVSHGGPSTVMDARMSGRLPIVVARDPAHHEHIDDHQMRFAEHLDRHGVAVVVDSRDGLFAAMDRALADPDSHAVTADLGNAAGVLSFARAVDALIGTRTPIERVEPVAAAPVVATTDGFDSTREPSTMAAPDRRRRPATNPLVERRKAPVMTTSDVSSPETATGHSDPGAGAQGDRRSPLAADAAAVDEGGLEAHLADRSVSVIIATRDRPRLLRRAITGVLAQRHDAPIEIIVVFDRSEPDPTLVDAAGDEGNGIDIVVTTNRRSPGLAGARNSGIDIASGAWIAFCDDDDEWLPGKLQAQFEALAVSPGCRAACTGILIRYQGNDTARMPDPDRLTFDGFLRDRMTEVHPSSWLVHRRTLVERIGLVDEEIPGSYAEDYDLFLRTARKTGIAVAGQPLVRVWWHGASFFFERWRMIDAALGYLTDKYPEFERHPEGLARIRGQQAVAQAAMGERGRALRTVAATARLHPLEKRLPLALAVAAGLKAESVLKFAHRFGKGI